MPKARCMSGPFIALTGMPNGSARAQGAAAGSTPERPNPATRRPTRRARQPTPRCSRRLPRLTLVLHHSPWHTIRARPSDRDIRPLPIPRHINRNRDRRVVSDLTRLPFGSAQFRHPDSGTTVAESNSSQMPRPSRRQSASVNFRLSRSSDCAGVRVKYDGFAFAHCFRSLPSASSSAPVLDPRAIHQRLRQRFLYASA